MKTLRALWPPMALCAMAIAACFIHWAAAPLVVLFLFDTVGRYRDFSFLRKQQPTYLTPKRMRYYGRSYCGRTLVKTLNADAADFYRSEGYRPWHLFPDRMFSKDTPLLKAKFWSNLMKGQQQ